MNVSRDELVNAGASPELAKLLVREFRQDEHRNDLTRNPMAVAFVVAFLGIIGCLALSVTDLEKATAGMQANVVSMKEDLTRIEAKVDAQSANIAEIRNLLVNRE